METGTKNKLKKIKMFLERNNKLNNKYSKQQDEISEKLYEMNNIQSKLHQYNDYKRNIHVAIGGITLVLTFFLTKNIFQQELMLSVITSLGLAITSSIGTHGIFKRKIKKLKMENPEIDFENSNYDENEKKRQKLLIKQMENSKKISDLKELNKRCEYCYENLINNENADSLKACEILNNKKICKRETPEETSKGKQKIYAMTIE